MRFTHILAQLTTATLTSCAVVNSPNTDNTHHHQSLATRQTASSPVYNISVADYPQGTVNATAWSLIYTYPLYIFSNFAGNVLRNVSVNTILHQRNLASPDSPGVIKPNVDTVYSRVVLDLSEHDVVLTIPEIEGGRYWNYPAIDVYGNIVAEIGIVNGNTAGKYLIRRALDASVQPGYGDANATQNSTGGCEYQGYVNMPTTYGTMLIRLLVKQNTTEDLDIIHAYQNASSLANVTRTRSSEPAPALTSLAPNGTFLGIDTITKMLDLAAKIVPYNEPQSSAERYRVTSILTLAGLYDSAYHAPPGLNLTYAASIANSSVTAATVNPSHLRFESNDWVLQRPAWQGVYGHHYAMRAYIAIAGYQQQTVHQTLYPGYKVLGFTGSFSLPDNKAVLLSFSGKPQLKPAGFWSYTVYGPDQYLIPNPLNRFEIGDRSLNLTYDSGGLVYGPDADSSENGPFKVLVQPFGQTPPSNWTGNWLPAAQNFSFILRWYVPQPAMTNGSYIYPEVDIIDAIV